MAVSRMWGIEQVLGSGAAPRRRASSSPDRGGVVSIQAIAWVLEHSRARGYDRLVLLAIANHADADGGLAWPSVAKIAGEAATSTRSVYRSLQVLVSLNELEVRSGGGRGNCNSYQLKGLSTRQQTLTDSHTSCLETVTAGPETLTEMSKNGDSAGTQNRPNRHEPRQHATRTIQTPARCVVCDKLEYDCLCDRGPLIQGLGRRDSQPDQEIVNL